MCIRDRVYSSSRWAVQRNSVNSSSPQSRVISKGRRNTRHENVDMKGSSVAVSYTHLVSGAAKTNVATFFFTLKPWGERKAPGDSSFDLARKLYGMGFGLEQGSFIAFNPPPISGMSNTGGFEMWLQDRNGRGSVELSDVAQKLAEAANKRPELQGVSTSFTVNAPQLFVELDRDVYKRQVITCYVLT